MAGSTLNIFETLLREPAPPSWHEAVRQSLGIPEECAGEALLCLSLHPASEEALLAPLAFALDAEQMDNTITALSEFLREAFHPVMGAPDSVALIDYLPALDTLGAAQGLSRRWLIDRYTLTTVMPTLRRQLRLLASGI